MYLTYPYNVLDDGHMTDGHWEEKLTSETQL
jgi:hypothetical protein